MVYGNPLLAIPLHASLPPTQPPSHIHLFLGFESQFLRLVPVSKPLLVLENASGETIVEFRVARLCRACHQWSADDLVSRNRGAMQDALPLHHKACSETLPGRRLCRCVCRQTLWSVDRCCSSLCYRRSPLAKLTRCRVVHHARLVHSERGAFPSSPPPLYLPFLRSDSV